MLWRIGEFMSNALRKAIFLDRDGTLNVEKGYVHQWTDWEWISGVESSLAKLKNAGYLLIIVSNQAGIARGYYNASEVEILNKMINCDLTKYGIAIDGFYHCPHHPDISGECPCRKPNPGMILQAAHDFSIDLHQSWLIGDKASDILAGEIVGLKTILVLSGYGRSESSHIKNNVPRCEDLPAASNLIIQDYAIQHAIHPDC